jgi:hypothetical protein
MFVDVSGIPRLYPMGSKLSRFVFGEHLFHCKRNNEKKISESLPGARLICGEGKRFVVRADEKLTAFTELESATGFAMHP